jgi:hypothetical protein
LAQIVSLIAGITAGISHSSFTIFYWEAERLALSQFSLRKAALSARFISLVPRKSDASSDVARANAKGGSTANMSFTLLICC